MPKGCHFGRTQHRHYISEYYRINAIFFKNLIECPLGKYSFEKEGASIEHSSFKLIETSKWSRVMVFNINGKEVPIPLQIDHRSASKKTYLICPYCVTQRQHLYITKTSYACRKCLNLHYTSQSERKPDRLARSIRKKRYLLWGYDYPDVKNLFESCIWWPKPKWIRWKTFEKKRNHIVDMEKQYWNLSLNMFDDVLQKEFQYLLDLGQSNT